jgi:hypothetical protein
MTRKNLNSFSLGVGPQRSLNKRKKAPLLIGGSVEFYKRFH